MRCRVASAARVSRRRRKNVIERIGMIWTRSNLSLGRRAAYGVYGIRSRMIRVLFSVLFSFERVEEAKVSTMARDREAERKWNTANRSACAQVINERNDFITFSLIFHRSNWCGWGCMSVCLHVLGNEQYVKTPKWNRLMFRWHSFTVQITIGCERQPGRRLVVGCQLPKDISFRFM